MSNQTNSETANRPPIPKIAYVVINPLMKLILRSPFHGKVSGNLMLLTFTGRKTGKQYTVPVGYVEMEGGLMVFTESNWWRNFQGGAAVRLRYKGRDVTGKAAIVEDADQIGRFIQMMVQKRGPQMAERMGFSAEPGQPPKGTQGRKFIRIELE